MILIIIIKQIPPSGFVCFVFLFFLLFVWVILKLLFRLNVNFLSFMNKLTTTENISGFCYQDYKLIRHFLLSASQHRYFCVIQVSKQVRSFKTKVFLHLYIYFLQNTSYINIHIYIMYNPFFN